MESKQDDDRIYVLLKEIKMVILNFHNILFVKLFDMRLTVKKKNKKMSR